MQSATRPKAQARARLAHGGGRRFRLLLGTVHAVEPSIAPTWRFISEYQLGPYGWVMRLAFLALFVSAACLLLALSSQAHHVVGFLGLA